MRRMILPLMLLVLACQPTSVELTQEQKAAIADTVRQLADGFFDDFNAVDFDRAMVPWASELVWVEQGKLGANRDSLDNVWRGLFDAIGEVTSGDWGEVHITVLGPDAAVFSATFDWAGVDTSGAPIGTPGAWTTVWLRTDDGWKIVQGHESFPMPESM